MALRPPKGMIWEDDPRVALIGHPAPPWLINYADLMTELVCFFVILYALSGSLDKTLLKTARDVEGALKGGSLNGQLSGNRDGLRISIVEDGGMAMFETGSADLTPRMREALDLIGPRLRAVAATHEIIVEGHTDDVPVAGGAYPSNWELSSARATSVVRYLVEQKGFPAGRIAPIGYGEHRPAAPNDAPNERAKNRRVVFLIKGAPASSGPAAP